SRTLSVPSKKRIMLRPAIARIETDRKRSLEVLALECPGQLNAMCQELERIISLLKPAVWRAVQQPRHWIVGEGPNAVEMIVRPLRAVLKGQPSNGVLSVLALIVPIGRCHFQPEDAPISDWSAVVKAEQGSDVIAAFVIEMRKCINSPPEVAIHLGPE